MKIQSGIGIHHHFVILMDIFFTKGIQSCAIFAQGIWRRIVSALSLDFFNPYLIGDF